MAEALLLLVGLILFASGCIGLSIWKDRTYKARFYRKLEEDMALINQTEEDKTDRIANLNSEIERTNRGNDHGRL